MAIIERKFEGLTQLGVAKVSLDDLCEQAANMERGWKDYYVQSPMDFDICNDDVTVKFTDAFGRKENNLDITDYAFGQMCAAVGVPAAYIQKCIKNGMDDLAIENYQRWSHSRVDDDRRNNRFLIRTYDDGTRTAVHAVLTSRYNVFSSAEVMNGLVTAMHTPELAGRYVANEAFLSPDRMHIRFVDFDNPIVVNRDTLHSGFAVSSNNIGSGAFSIKYFLFRFACKNGMVRIQNGGLLYRQTHLRAFETEAPELFAEILKEIKVLDQQSRDNIKAAMNIHLSDAAFDTLLTKAQHELHLGKGGKEKLIELSNTVYGRSLWGAVNCVTELAQNYTLEDRIAMEQWAGNTLTTFAA